MRCAPPTFSLSSPSPLMQCASSNTSACVRSDSLLSAERAALEGPVHQLDGAAGVDARHQHPAAAAARQDPAGPPDVGGAAGAHRHTPGERRTGGAAAVARAGPLMAVP